MELLRSELYQYQPTARGYPSTHQAVGYSLAETSTEHVLSAATLPTGAEPKVTELRSEA